MAVLGINSSPAVVNRRKLEWLVPLLEGCLCFKVVACVLSMSIHNNETVDAICNVVLCVNWCAVVLYVSYQIAHWQYCQWFVQHQCWYKKNGDDTTFGMTTSSSSRPVQGMSLPLLEWMDRANRMGKLIIQRIRNVGRWHASDHDNNNNNTRNTSTTSESEATALMSDNSVHPVAGDRTRASIDWIWKQPSWIQRILSFDTTPATTSTETNTVEMQPLLLSDPNPIHMERLEDPLLLVVDKADLDRDKNV
ncbi:expressed unknown protein [Seminavis robusta]|uniref:Uncharacterized protein n=1 Tax=Seminavis robusta TaxID=568900 RepID=A0A9N8DPE1_9STRA|nr:expressed unknown protein [Seminavis robusta]|eukprot:Sro252_g099540.1 n/a (250) ;mRNA; r:13965-14714